MPYSSQAQEKFFNSNRSKLMAKGVDVEEFNSASKGMKLPIHSEKNSNFVKPKAKMKGQK